MDGSCLEGLARRADRRLPDCTRGAGQDRVPQCPHGFSVRISGSAQTGIHVVATGSETFAIGMAIALKSRLSGGVEAGERAARVPPDAADLIAGALVGALTFAIGAFGLVRDLGPAVSGLLALTALGVCTQAAYSTVWVRRGERRPPAFRVVREGQQFPDDTVEGDGLLWNAKKWLDRCWLAPSSPAWPRRSTSDRCGFYWHSSRFYSGELKFVCCVKRAPRPRSETSCCPSGHRSTGPRECGTAVGQCRRPDSRRRTGPPDPPRPSPTTVPSTVSRKRG